MHESLLANFTNNIRVPHLNVDTYSLKVNDNRACRLQIVQLFHTTHF